MVTMVKPWLNHGITMVIMVKPWFIFIREQIVFVLRIGLGFQEPEMLF